MPAAPCVLAAHDGHSHVAARVAAGLAGLIGVPLVIAEVYRHEPGHDALNARRFDAAQVGVARAVAHLPDSVEVERVTLPAGDVAVALVEAARDAGAAALVLGPDQRGHVTHDVLRLADFPVVVTPSDLLLTADPLQRIGVAFDGSIGSHFALAAGRRLARRAGAELELIAVARHERDRAELRRLLDAELAEGASLERAVVLDGHASHELRLESERLDLLCCGSRGRPELLGAVLGSTSSALVTEPPCAVLVVPPRARSRSSEPLGLTRAAR